MKKLFASFIFCALCCHLLSQNLVNNSLQHVDSLKKVLTTLDDDRIKVDILMEIAVLYQYKLTDSTIYYCKEAIQLAEEIKYTARQMQSMGVLAEAYIYKGDLSQALELSLEVLKLKEKYPDLVSTDVIPTEGPALYNLSEIYYQIGDDKRSIDYADQMIGIKTDIAGIAYGHYLKARVFEKNNQLREATEEIERSFQKFTEVGKVHYYSNLYNAYPDLFNVRARVHFKQGNVDLATSEFNSQLEQSKKAGEIFHSVNTCNDLSRLYANLGMRDSSIYYAERAIIEADKINFVQGQLDARIMLADQYESTDPVKALQNYKQASKIQNELFGAGNIQILKDLIAKDDQRRNDLASAEEAFANRLRFILFSVGLGILTIASFLLYRGRRKSEKSRLLLETTLTNLKSTQAQLVQSEKMASLGELTAGIAHEIQNPLNFVNNFSEVNSELIDELTEELDNQDYDEVRAIAKDIKENELKINHHGKRADAIVKGMLQHSRTSTGQKETTDINALCDEYLRLSYHARHAGRQGLRAKDSTFNADYKTDFDPSLPKVNVISQDIGRVLLNLINNAFYAVHERSKKDDEFYKPAVSISTKNLGDKIQISVSDNGPGIPDSIKEKIFQPFFTTKPTGQGTGLGLSLSYDIVMAHGGQISIDSKVDEGTKFIIQLPTKA